MTLTSAAAASNVAFRYGNPAFDCEGVRMRARCRQLATVVTVSGEITGANLDCVGDYARRYILAEKPFVLDVSDVTSFTNQGLSTLYDLDDACREAGVEWSLVASQPVMQVLRAAGAAEDLPITGSVPEALHHFSEGILARRRLLPLLTKTA
jgi:anti-anti-sigma factor